jgi:hypothetical protein
MSRVHTAFRRAEIQRERLPGSFGSNPVPFAVNLAANPGPDSRADASPDSHADAAIALEETRDLERYRATRPLLTRVLHNLMRRLGFRTGAPVPLCSGVTVRGLPCRGLAMANGYCRMHGGSRRPWVKAAINGEADLALSADSRFH